MNDLSKYIFMATLGLASCAGAGKPFDYPHARRTATSDVIHGVKVRDPYRWLEEAGAEDVKRWVTEENTLTRELLDARPGRDAIRARLREIARTDSFSAPVKRGDRYFYARRNKDQEKWVRYWKQGEDGTEQVLLDPNTLSEDGSVSIGWAATTRDGKMVAYSVSQDNADEAVLHLMEVDTGEEWSGEQIPGVNYTYPQWLPDGSGFYYSQLPVDPDIPTDERPGHAVVRFHRLGTDPADDPVVYPATGDPSKLLSVDSSWDGNWLVVGIFEGISNDVYFEDLRDPDAGFRPLVVGRDFRYEVVGHQGQFYVRTNDGASRYRIVRVDPAHPEREHWETVVAEDPEATLQEFQVVGGYLVARFLRDAADEIRVYDTEGSFVRELELPGIGSASSLVGDPDRTEAFYYFSSFVMPPRIYETDVATGDTKLWAEIEVPVDPSPYLVRQVRYQSKDGTEIPMFLVHRKDLQRDGTHRVLLTGYGGFTVTLKSSFNRWIYPWLESGGVYAMANLRGGGEYGDAWHRAGMLGNKQNVFDDFIAATEYLVSEGYTTPSRLAIEGGSNGGLLMGAVTVQAPENFGAVLCSAPLLDMIRYQRFGMGRVWIPEYGDPENPEQFRWLFAYSPYHHVVRGTEYPAFLMMSPESDDRVDPMHARKFVAALQWAQSGDAPVLLRVETNAGHGGGDMISKTVEVYTDIYTFLEWRLDEPLPAPAAREVR